jgi:hypothetical protein
MIKRLGLWALCLLFGLPSVKAQQGSDSLDAAEVTERFRETDTSLWYANQYVFARLDTNRIPSGILLDYGITFTDPAYFEGRVLGDSNYCNYRLLEQLNSSFYSSIICTRGEGTLASPRELFDRSKVYAGTGTLALSGLLLDYQAFGADAADKLDTAQGQLYERYAPGHGPDPYDTRTVFAVSLPCERYDQNSLRVLLPRELWFSNKQAAIRDFAFDADDGLGWRPLNPGEGLDIVYETDGLKEWRFKISLEGGQVLLAHSGLLLETAKTTEGEFLEAFTVRARESYMKEQAQARVRIKYAASDGVLRRPLVLVEGFDPGKFLAPDQFYGFSDCKSIFDGDYRKLKISNQLRFEIGGGKYDLVYVDWEDGTDYLQNNALALESVLAELNRRKQPLGGVRQQNVVWGFSMGGVISRYALKDMEDRGLDHETRLFVSQDAPHLGAHIPQGYLEMVDHLNELWFKTGKVKDMAGSSGTVPMSGSVTVNDLFKLPYRPAAAQMLYGHVGSSYKDWQAELQRKGYPVRCRNIAISNGSECGNPQPITPGALQMGFRGQVRLELLANLALNNVLGAVGLKIVAGALAPPVILGMLPGGARWDMNFAVNGDADMSEQRLYFGELSYTKTVGYLIPITKSLSKASYSRKGSYAWETFGGGYFAAPLEGLDTLKGGAFPWFNYSGRLEGQNRFGFVPTASALDIGRGAKVLSKAQYTARYASLQPPAAPYNTPFDAFIAEYDPSDIEYNNTQHININDRNADWLGHQLAGTAPANCNCPCIDQSKIQGPDGVCNKGAVSYMVQPLASAFPGTVSWDLNTTPPGIATLTPSGYTCIVTVPAGVFGRATLSARITNSCAASPVYKKDIYIGSPPYTGVFSIRFETDPAGGYKAIASPYYPEMTYRWAEQYYRNEASGGSTKTTTPYAVGTNEYAVKYAPSKDFARSDERVYLEVQNACGGMTMNKLKPDPGPFWRLGEEVSVAQHESMHIYPNPASQSWYIDLSQVQEAATRLQVYDMDGRLLLDRELHASADHVLQIDNSALRPGMYLARILLAKGMLHAKLVKN